MADNYFDDSDASSMVTDSDGDSGIMTPRSDHSFADAAAVTPAAMPEPGHQPSQLNPNAAAYQGPPALTPTEILSAATADLPPGWCGAVTAQGRLYFYDRNSRSSSWTHPSLLPAKVVAASDVNQSNGDLTATVRKLIATSESLQKQVDVQSREIKELKAENVSLRAKDAERDSKLESFSALQDMHSNITTAQQGHLSNLDKLLNMRMDVAMKDVQTLTADVKGLEARAEDNLKLTQDSVRECREHHVTINALKEEQRMVSDRISAPVQVFNSHINEMQGRIDNLDEKMTENVVADQQKEIVSLERDMKVLKARVSATTAAQEVISDRLGKISGTLISRMTSSLRDEIAAVKAAQNQTHADVDKLKRKTNEVSHTDHPCSAHDAGKFKQMMDDFSAKGRRINKLATTTNDLRDEQRFLQDELTLLKKVVTTNLGEMREQIKAQVNSVVAAKVEEKMTAERERMDKIVDRIGRSNTDLKQYRDRVDTMDIDVKQAFKSHYDLISDTKKECSIKLDSIKAEITSLSDGAIVRTAWSMNEVKKSKSELTGELEKYKAESTTEINKTKSELMMEIDKSKSDSSTDERIARATESLEIELEKYVFKHREEMDELKSEVRSIDNLLRKYERSREEKPSADDKINEPHSASASQPNEENINYSKSTASDTCPVCKNPMVHKSTWGCNHVTCHVCALRRRNLGNNKTCFECGVMTGLVIFHDDLKTTAYYELQERETYATDYHHGVRYMTEDMFLEATDFRGYSCPDPHCNFRASVGLAELDVHISSVHGKKTCLSCTIENKLFCHEQKLFSPAEYREHYYEVHEKPWEYVNSFIRG
ncbi:hypothetical protein LTR37_004648 [Vermiconidia calcicola]|uniref:Uncharacterized protein n=1 Tax=Vermiconidia calcicola TaxID=1690605 RepID=A0ACC3NLE3_9PEZI|nr:hypothetical protein LTR37_004648 [Vermiconidia calcicola]